MRWLKIGVALPSPTPGLDPVTCLRDDPVAIVDARERPGAAGRAAMTSTNEDVVVLATTPASTSAGYGKSDFPVGRT